VAKEFSLTFDGCRAKVGDIQLEITKKILSEATGLPLTGQKWFKNLKLGEVPWSLFVTSRNIHCCDKGIPVSLLNIRWHGLLAVLRQFITCEGRFGLVFLYHIRLLMHFIGFHLHISFFMLRSLYKMSKRYKKQNLDSSLFHHGLIKLLLVHHLKTFGEYWDSFIACNGFVTVNPIETTVMDNPMIEKPLKFSIGNLDLVNNNPFKEALSDQLLCGNKVLFMSLSKLLCMSQMSTMTLLTNPTLETLASSQRRIKK
jgi:hypothetical protein